MNPNALHRYLRHIPAIQKMIVEHEIDTLVCGVGPTAWLLPWMDQRIIKGLHVWGTHDFWRIYPCDTLVIMDPPQAGLDPAMQRYRHIVEARPGCIRVYEPALASWLPHLSEAVHGIVESARWKVWQIEDLPPPDMLGEWPFRMIDTLPHTTCVSPLGATTLAWKTGHRRIGVLGADMMQGHHHTFAVHKPVDAAFAICAREAAANDGIVLNLSPISSLTKFIHANDPVQSLAGN